MTSGTTTTFFGLLSVNAVLSARSRPLKVLYICSDSSTRGLARVVAEARAQSVPVQTWSGDKLVQHFGQDVPDVALETGPRAYLSPDALLGTLRGVDDPWVLALEGVEDPHQLGAVFRTAVATGVGAILLPRRLSELSPDLVARSSAGTSERAVTCVAEEISQGLALLGEDGFRVVAACAEAEQSVYEVNLRGRLCLVIGGRHRGLSAETLAVCSERLRLPMEGDVPSLTVASCAGALLYEAYRQRHAR